MTPETTKAEIVIISMGSNIENRLNHLINATKLLNKHPSIKLEECSPIYQSKAQGFESDDFYNNIIIVSTTLSPIQLLHFTQNVERDMGRNKNKIRSKNHTARKIDIDILFYGNKYINTSELIIPHPETFNRDFVTIPLNNIKNTNSFKQIEILETNYYKDKKNTLVLCKKASSEFMETFNMLKQE